MTVTFQLLCIYKHVERFNVYQSNESRYYTFYMMKTIKANPTVLPEISYYPNSVEKLQTMIHCSVTCYFRMISSNRLIKIST